MEPAKQQIHQTETEPSTPKSQLPHFTDSIHNKLNWSPNTKTTEPTKQRSRKIQVQQGSRNTKYILVFWYGIPEHEHPITQTGLSETGLCLFVTNAKVFLST